MDFPEYRQAVIHLAWFRDDQVRHLLFGMVELRPNELPDTVGCPPKKLSRRRIRVVNIFTINVLSYQSRMQSTGTRMR